MKIAVILICSFFGSLGNAQNLTQVFTLYPELSSLSSIIANSSSLFKQLEAANDYTFLAPSNDAIAARVKSPSSNASIDTVLAYHLFHRILPLTRETLPSNGTFDDTETSFLISSLTDSKYALVSGGQRAKFMFNDEALIQSGNRTTSQITIANIMWKGGITHIIDTVLEFPMDALIQATTARLSYFAGIFNSGGLLNASNAGPVMRIGTMPDATYFFPDSESTLTSFKQNSLEPSMLLEYHAVQGLYYSTNFTNGTTLNTTAGVPLLVTLDENGDIYLNTAKITTPDYLIFNGVMHVIDSILTPNNISRPLLSSTTNTTDRITSSGGLSTGAKARIGVGTAVGVTAIVMTLFACWFRRYYKSYRIRDSAPIEKSSTVQGVPELSGNGIYEYPQLEAHERTCEMGDSSRHEIGGFARHEVEDSARHELS